MNFLVLGASGLIGRFLVRHFEETGQNCLGISRANIHKYLSSQNSLSDCLFEEFKNSNAVCIINCFGKPKSNSIDEIMEGNFEMPKKFYELSKNLDGLWINFNSYFTLYQEQFGFAKDSYSESKRNLNIYLQQNSTLNKLRIYNLMLGHVVSPYENPERFFSQFFKSVAQKRDFHLSEGQQFLPITTLQNICEAVNLMTEDFISSQTTRKYQELTLKPQVIDKLSNIVLELARRYGHLDHLYFDLPYQEHEFFDLEWPKKLPQIACRDMSIHEIFQDYENYYAI
jgi:nucleoside-diphosphate-sugar epimerase